MFAFILICKIILKIFLFASQLFFRDRTRDPIRPHELLQIFRFPHSTGRDIAIAAEQFEQTLQNVHRHVEAGMFFDLKGNSKKFKL